ncbi:MAG TPA: type IV toxin-antitoxin system AbiEi family antitoxin domain-containing protein [Piscinibacter sp.]|nr:type IV toxin-antitoxin system AbiEi family antitoxin domain-containing protein [Piscinibacter sp.]
MLTSTYEARPVRASAFLGLVTGHDLAFKERLVPWGDVPTTLPDWFTEVFLAAHQGNHLFDDTLPAAVGLAPLPGGRADLLVSAPERAVLELLSDIGNSQGLEEARHLVEGARSLRCAWTCWTRCWPISNGSSWPGWPTRSLTIWTFHGRGCRAATANASVEAGAGCRPRRLVNGST